MLWVTGKQGQLGRALQQVLPHALFTDRTMVDITNPDAVARFVDTHEITTIINCAAYTAVDQAETDQESAYLINQYGPKYLAKTGAALIHISTDYVFDGKHSCPYKTTDKAAPRSIYGKSKYAGEQEVLHHASTGVVMRTAWLYAPWGHNFVNTMLRLGRERKQISVVCDQLGSPTYACDVAEAIVTVREQLQPEHAGIYHYTNSGYGSWFEFAQTIMYEASLSCQVMPLTSMQYPTAAPRPAYSVLDSTKIAAEFGLMIPRWKDGLQRMLQATDLST